MRVTDEAPELTQADFAQARFEVAGQPVSRTEWQVAVRNQVHTYRALNIEVPLVELVVNDTGLPNLTFPVQCPYTQEHILDKTYYPTA